jgi:tetratricopeptide (TPR) repeat protein
MKTRRKIHTLAWFRTECCLGLLALLLAAGCQKKAAVQKPATPPPPDPQIKGLVLKGDEFSAQQHLLGWRKAEEFYAKADALGGEPGLKEKLLLIRVLLIARETDEDVPIASIQRSLASSCTSVTNTTGLLLCEFAQRYVAPWAAIDKKPSPGEKPEIPVFAAVGEALDDYFRILYSRAAGIELPDNFELSAWERHKSSPLFVYLNLRKAAMPPVEQLENDFPDFAEAYVLTGERRMQSRRYREARAYFNKALELVPDYTRAINGLGNILLFIVEEYAEALRHYERTLKHDRSNSGGLYGKGVVLHSMGMFADSNQVLDQLISGDLTRGGRLDDSNARYFRGMGRYYQAYNHYKLFQPQEARRLIDLAKKELPWSEQINFLSGVLYFNANEMENARLDLEQVLATGNSNCEAYNYLGLIYMQKDENRAAQYFLGMCSCVESAIASAKRDIASLSMLDLEPAELNGMKARLTERLLSFRKTSSVMIENAITMMGLIKSDKRDVYRGLMRETLLRLALDLERK